MTEKNNYPFQNRRQCLEGMAFTAYLCMIAHLSQSETTQAQHLNWTQRLQHYFNVSFPLSLCIVQ